MLLLLLLLGPPFDTAGISLFDGGVDTTTLGLLECMLPRGVLSLEALEAVD